MKKNLYYRTMFKRTNAIKELILNLFLSLSSWPKLVLEVFLRKNFGERYFSFATCIVIGVFLAAVPFAFMGAKMLINSYGDTGSNWWLFIFGYLTWYIFIGLFISFAVKRWREVKRNRAVFDFKRFSLYAGDIEPSFYNIRLFGKKPDIRTIEILYEPALCFAVGLGCILFGQFIGYVIVLCSIIYALSYAGAYYKGDQFVLDKVDEMIANENLFKTFVEDKDAIETGGVRFYGRKPVDDDMRRKVMESFTEGEKEEASEVF